MAHAYTPGLRVIHILETVTLKAATQAATQAPAGKAKAA